jgi:uncharacterized protein (UPF0147 family)
MENLLKTLEMMKDDFSIPKNIRSKLNEAYIKLTEEGDKIKLYTEAITLLDEAANDQNCPPHVQTMIYQMLADIEKEIEKLRKQ